MIPEGTKLADVAAWLRLQYPDAVAVSLFVNHSEYEVEARHRVIRKGEPVSMQRLDGAWVEKV